MSADLIVIGEVSVSTFCVANCIPLTLRSISDHSETDFSEKELFGGRFVAVIPAGAKGFSTPVIHKLNTQSSCWNSIRKYHHQTLEDS
jgi:hypothetical protein